MKFFTLSAEVNVDTSGVKTALDDATKSAESAGSKISSTLQSTGDKLSTMGKKLTTTVTAGVVGLGAAAVKSSMTFEDAMAKVSTIADTSQVSMEQLQKSILDLSDQTGISSAEIADNVYNAISAGQSTGEAVNFVSNATMLARAGFAETGDALDILTTIMNSYGESAGTVDEISDRLITTQNLGKTTVAELSSAMGKAIPTAKEVGVNIDQLCASYAIMTSNGIATAETTTYLNSMMNELGKKGTTAADAFAKGTESIKEGGLTMKEAMDMGWSLSDVLGVLNEQAEASGTSINNMFGSAEAGKAASVLWDNTEGLNSAVEKMGASAGSTEEAFAKLETNSYELKKVLNEAKNTLIDLGGSILEVLMPYLQMASDKIREFCEWFKNLDDEQKNFIVKIGLVVAAIGPFLLILGKVISVVGTIISVGSTIISGITAIAGFIGTVLIPAIASVGAPVLIIIGVITALVAIGVLLYKNWDTIKEKCIEIFGYIKEFIQEKIASIKEAFNTVIEFFKNNWKDILLLIVNPFAGAFKLLYNNCESFRTFVDNFLTNIKTKIHDAIEKIKGFFKFEWSLPHLKLPHISISGSFSLDPPKVPSFGIDWYAKAMNQPMIMDRPTAFGINSNGQLMAGGEAGSEVVSGTDTLMNMISGAVSQQNERMLECCENMLSIMAQYMPEMANMQLVTDTGALVGAIAPQIDNSIGVIAKRKQRG